MINASTKPQTTRIAHGGLMRCCIDTLLNHLDTDKDVHVNDIVNCKYETNAPTEMILGEDLVWRWNHELNFPV